MAPGRSHSAEMLPPASILLPTMKHQPWGSQKLPLSLPVPCFKDGPAFFSGFLKQDTQKHPKYKIGITVASTFQKPHEDAPGLLKSGRGLKLADMQHPESTIQKQMRSVSQKLGFCIAV